MKTNENLLKQRRKENLQKKKDWIKTAQKADLDEAKEYLLKRLKVRLEKGCGGLGLGCLEKGDLFALDKEDIEGLEDKDLIGWVKNYDEEGKEHRLLALTDGKKIYI